jgi:TatD DNase family protein
VGWHPQAADEYDGESGEKIRRWAKNGKVKAIGEIGLDYYYEGASHETQKSVFRAQMALAQELNLPVIVHDREAHADSMEIVRQFTQVHGVFHCYSGSAEMAKELLSRGWYLSFTGAVTFKNARKALETVEICPMERIMIETDSPYLAPVPHRGHRNDSSLLPYIAQVIADVKGVSVQEAARITRENGKRFFDIA